MIRCSLLLIHQKRYMAIRDGLQESGREAVVSTMNQRKDKRTPV